MSSAQPISPGAKLHVVIVGAGIGGLTLALLLERAGVSYVVLEKTKSIKPLGSALSFSGTVTYLLRQLGIFEEFQAASLKLETVKGYDGECKPAYLLDFKQLHAMSGSDGYIIARPIIHDILHSKIPKEKILLNKRVLTILNGDNGARVDCTDGSTFDGDIIVGADGAYSPVRQGLFKWLKKSNRLPPSDDVPMPYKYVCLVGQTGVLDLTKNTTSFRSSEWGPEAALSMANTLRDLPLPDGGKSGKILGDLIDKTDKDLISKVVLEEKVYKSWYGGRTVLMGDACHKLNPAGGAGAMSAMHDAVCLTNWINVLPSLTVKDLETTFREYYQERYPYALEAYKASALRARGLENNLGGAIARFINANMPKWLWTILLRKGVEYRPQVSCLRHVEDTGSVRPNAQPSLIKTRMILETLARKQQKDSSSLPSSSTTTTDASVI